MGRSLMKQPQFQVVGVVASVKNSTLVRDSEPAIYFSFRQFPFRGLNIVVQGQGDAAALLGALRTSVQRLDPNLPVASARTVDRIVGEATDRPVQFPEVFATLYHNLGIDVNKATVPDLSGRPRVGLQVDVAVGNTKPVQVAPDHLRGRAPPRPVDGDRRRPHPAHRVPVMGGSIGSDHRHHPLAPADSRAPATPWSTSKSS